MTVSIDSTTIVLAVILVDIFMIVLIISYKNILKDRSLKIFLAAKICQMTNFILWGLGVLMTGAIDTSSMDFFYLIVENVLFVSAIALEGLAVLALFGAGRLWAKKILPLATAAFAAAYSFLYFAVSGQEARIVLVSAFCMLFILYPALHLLFNHQKSYLQRIVGILYLLVIGGFLSRMLVAVGLFHASFASVEEIYSWINFALFVMMILSGTGYFLLAKEQADIRLLKRANTDSLTGILNRRAFAEQGKRSLRYFERKKGPVSFLLFDIDDFKKVNDTYGHYVGDTALKEVALIVQEGLRSYDLFGRYGGDEFAILLPDANEEEASLVAERMRRTIEIKAIYEHAKIRITICIGIVTIIPTKETDLKKIYRMADGALYEAKLMGGNCVVCSRGQMPEMGEDIFWAEQDR